MGRGRPDAKSRPAATPRALDAWRALSRERRLAAIAAIALFVSMLLPWYQQNGFDHHGVISSNLDAFSVFSFVEAAILLVALSVLTLLYTRAGGRTFHLPGSDGAVVLAGGLWTVLLLVLRLFDKPGIATHGIAADVGLQWGIFFALGAAGLLAYAGARMRAAERPEPPLLRGRDARRRDEPRRGRGPAREREAAWGAFEPAGPAGARRGTARADSRRRGDAAARRSAALDAASASEGPTEARPARDDAGEATTRISGAGDGSEDQTAITPARRLPAPGPKAVPARPAMARDPKPSAHDDGQLSFDDVGV